MCDVREEEEEEEEEGRRKKEGSGGRLRRYGNADIGSAARYCSLPVGSFN